MTRLHQWITRRNKFIRRSERIWNTRERGARATIDGPDAGGPQHAGGWAWDHDGVLLPPRIKAATRKAQIFPFNQRLGVSLVGQVGYGKPPHYKADAPPPPLFYPKVHLRYEAYGTHTRTVKRWKRKAGRIKGSNWVCYLAWLYWKKRNYFPDWDPKMRTPVDPAPVSRDDPW